MPHLIIEHDSSLNSKLELKKIVRDLHYFLSEIDGVKKNAIKTRSIEVQNLHIGFDESFKHMIAIQILLLNETRIEYKKKMADLIRLKTQDLVNNETINVTVDVRDLGVYSKP